MIRVSIGVDIVTKKVFWCSESEVKIADAQETEMRKKIPVQKIVKNPVFIVAVSIMITVSVSMLCDKTRFAPLASILAVASIFFTAFIILKNWVQVIKRWFN